MSVLLLGTRWCSSVSVCVFRVQRWCRVSVFFQVQRWCSCVCFRYKDGSPVELASNGKGPLADQSALQVRLLEDPVQVLIVQDVLRPLLSDLCKWSDFCRLRESFLYNLMSFLFCFVFYWCSWFWMDGTKLCFLCSSSFFFFFWSWLRCQGLYISGGCISVLFWN